MLIVEVLMFVGGIVAMVTAKLPPWLLGGAKYKYEGPGVRWLGLILALPLPVAFLSGVVLGFLLEEDGVTCASTLEIVLLVLAAIAAILVGRRIRQPVAEVGGEEGTASQAEVEALIAKKAQGSMAYALLGLLGPMAFVLCPLVLMRTRQALRLIDEHQVGEQYRLTARNARTLALIILVGWSVVIVFGGILILFGSRM